MRTITLAGRQLWPRPARPARHVHAPADTRSPVQRWEDGPRLPPGREVGSMNLDDDDAYRLGAFALRSRGGWELGRCDDTDQFGPGTVMLPRLGNAIGWDSTGGAWTKAPGGPRVYEDDTPGLRAYRADLDRWAAENGIGELHHDDPGLFALDPAAWRPYLTEAEFTEAFPGVPYAPQLDDGPHTGDLAAIDYRHAEQLADRDAEVADWLRQRAAAHADLRARLLIAWQAIGQRGA